MLMGLGQQNLSAKLVRPFCQKLIDRPVYPVKMSLRVGTAIRIALHLLADAELFLRRQGHRLHAQALPPQDPEGLLRHRARHRLRRQVKDPVPQIFTHGLHRRKHRGNRLADSCGGLDEQPLLPGNRPVDPRRQLPLALPVGKREFQRLNAGFSKLLPFILEAGPFLILLHQPEEPFPQFLPRPGLPEILQLLRLQISVGELHADLRQLLPLRVDTGVAESLGQMHAHRLPDEIQIPVHALDLVDVDQAVLRENPVRAALHHAVKFSHGDTGLQRDLRLIACSHPPLYFSVKTSPCLHGQKVCLSRRSAVQISLPQDKFHQRAHGDPDLCSHFVHSTILAQKKSPVNQAQSRDSIRIKTPVFI